MIIDAHAHIMKDIHGQTGTGETRSAGYGKLARGGDVIQLFPPLREDTSFPPEVLLAYMDWVGVDRAVLLQGPFYGEANEYVYQAVSAHPDRFIGAAYIDPRAADARETLQRCVGEYGFGIIKLELSVDAGLVGLHPDLCLSEPGMAWLWDEADRGYLVVTLDLGSIGTKSYQTEAVGELVQRYPDLRFVIAHLGHPPADRERDPNSFRAWREQLLLARNANVWFDLAALPVCFADEDYPYPGALAYVREAVELVGPDRLMWGSDVPGLLGHATYRQLLDIVARHCDFLSEEDLAKVMGGNADEVYGTAVLSVD